MIDAAVIGQWVAAVCLIDALQNPPQKTVRQSDQKKR